MNKIIALTLLLASFTGYAAQIDYKVTDAVCGEIDPYEIGDACVLILKKDADSMAIVIDLDLIAGTFENSQALIDRTVLIKGPKLKLLTRSQREVIGDFVPGYMKVYHAEASDFEIK